MKAGTRNIVRKQVLNLRYKGKADGFALQREFTDWYYRELFPEMQALMDQLAPEHIHVRLDSLKVDLVIDGTNEWKQVLRKQALEDLHDKLRREIQYNAPVEKTSLLSATAGFFELLKYYLQKGFLPWWSSIKTKKEFDAVLEEWLLSADAKKYITGIKEVLGDKQAGYRMAILMEDKVFEYFIQFLSGSEAFEKKIRQLQEDLSSMAFHFPVSKKQLFILLFKQVVVEKMRRPEPEQKIKEIISGFFDKAIVQFQDEIKSIKTSLTRSEELKKGIEDAKRRIDRSMLSHSADHEKELTGEERPAGGEKPVDMLTSNKEDQEETSITKDEAEQISPVSKMPVKKELNDASGSKIKDPRPRTEETFADIREGIFINNAGLVIVASFLPMLFKKLLLVNQNGITDRSRAVMLVQYLASGKEIVAEFELGLAKILCGLEMETAIDTTVILSEEEKQEATELLLSAIEYWSILGNTSVQGLRDSFLLRDGKLSFDKNEWLLQVEQRSYDMLLQNLPWNISMIKLAWMPAMLKTEWFN